MTIVASAGLVSAVTTLAATLAIGIRRRDAAVIVNASVSLVAVALVGVVIQPVSGGGDETNVVLASCIAIAGVLHMVGMLGWYDAVWWWDHVTHTVSAAIVAAVLYAWVLVAGPDVFPGGDGRVAAAGWTLVLTAAAGLCWEVLEHAARHLSDRVGVERVLKHYGRFDTPLDLGFDLLGAALVVGFDVRLFTALFEPIPETTRTLLIGALGAIALVSVASTAIVVYGRRMW